MTGVPFTTELRLLKGFELLHRDVTTEVPANVQRLLAYLGLRARPQHRSIVAGTLWADTSEARASASLRTALWRARCVDTDLVTTSGSYLSLGRTVRVDFIAMLDRAHRLANDQAFDPDTTSDCFCHDLLPGWFDEWVLTERERVRQLALHALETLCARLTALGRFDLAVEAGLAAVQSEPLRESAQRILIEAHLAEHNVAEAVRQYEAYRRVLREDLGIEPSEELWARMQGVLTNEHHDRHPLVPAGPAIRGVAEATIHPR